MAFLHCLYIGILLSPWFPSWGKCIFDKVQGSVKVVSPPIKQHNLSHWSLKETALSYQRLIIGSENPAPVSKPQRTKRADKEEESFDLQPIRIKTWIPKKSPALSHLESERLMTAVHEAVSKVSSLLSGVWCLKDFGSCGFFVYKFYVIICL